MTMQRTNGVLTAAMLMVAMVSVTNLRAADIPVPATPAAPVAAPERVVGKLEGHVLSTGGGRVFIIDSQGKVTWENQAGSPHDAWMLPSGNVLFADGNSVTEVTLDHKVVFSYKATEQKGGGTYSCQRLENGRTLIGENSTGRVLEVEPDGKVVFELQTQPVKIGDHHNFRMVRKLDNGNYLVCHSGPNILKEYAPDGKVVLEIKTPGLTFAAIRTAQNTTLVSLLNCIKEYDATGKVVWEFANTNVPPGVKITNITGIQILPNGNIVAGCYGAYQKNEGTGIFEITRDKQIVWRYSNPTKDGSMMGVQLLTADGKALPGKCLR